MIDIKRYTLKEETLTRWIELFVPKRQLLIFKEQNEFLNTEPIHQIKNELTIDEKNAYMPWMFKKEAKYGILLNTNDYDALPNGFKKEIIKEQIELNRGLIFPNLDAVLLDYTSWIHLSFDKQKEILIKFAEEFIESPLNIETELIEKLAEKYPYIAPYFNTYSDKNGANCFATAIFALTGNENIVNKWMKQDEFIGHLKENHYITLEDPKDFLSKDMIVWFDKETPVHACFCLDETYVFNKNGQMLFNPYQILTIQEVLNEWNQYEYHIYRKR